MMTMFLSIQDEEMDDDGEVHARRVGFSVEAEDGPEREGKLRRRDTPHHLKNKRVGDNFSASDSEKVQRIVMQTSVVGAAEKEDSAEVLIYFLFGQL